MKYHFTSFEILSYTWLNESLFHQSKKQSDERFENECIEARVVVAIVIVKFKSVAWDGKKQNEYQTHSDFDTHVVLFHEVLINHYMQTIEKCLQI